MTYNTSNFSEQGGASWTVGGTLTLESGSTVVDSRFSASTTVAADVLPIPVTARFVSKTTGADAEALTLADGVSGQVLTVSLVTDGGGAGTLTPSTSTGWATVVFADAGDTVTLEYIDDTVGWIILGAFGAAAQPAVALS